jgi:hypothetical protein
MVEFQHALTSSRLTLSDQSLNVTALEIFRIPTGMIQSHARPTECSQHPATTKESVASTTTKKYHSFSENSINQ